MSRPVTDAFKAAAFAQETGEVVVTLLTITHPDMEETIRISSDPTQRLGNYDLDFTAGTLPSAAVLTRASAGTYVDSDGVIQSAANDEPRFTHTSAGAMRGLLVEPSRQNTCFPSASIPNVGGDSWGTLNGMTLATDVSGVTAPDGTETASRLTETATTASHSISLASASPFQANGPNTVSIYLREGGGSVTRYGSISAPGTNFTASGQSEGVAFDLVAGVIAGIGTTPPAAYGIEDAGAGWWRCWVTFLTGANVSSGVRIGASGNGAGGLPSYLGDTNASVLLWGAQVEHAAAPPSSPIPTTTAAATRVADGLAISVFDDGDYDIAIERESGTTTLIGEAVTGSFAVPADLSPLRRVTMSMVRPQPIYGTISRGEQYLFVPFDLTLPDEQDETAPNAKIRLSNVGREVMELVRSVDTPAKIVLEILLGSDLETVEVAFPELHIAQAEYTAGELTLGLVVDFLSEIPFPGGTFGPAYFPGLFG